MKFPNKASAIKFIEASGIVIDQKVVLVDLIEEHALDREIMVIGTVDEITGIMFEADHDVSHHIELNDVVIDAHSLAGVASVNNTQTKEKIMTAQNNQAADQAKAMAEMEKLIADSMKNVLSASMDGILEAALKKQQERIDETVKKTVDEAVKKAVDEALKSIPKDAETKKVEETKKETPKEEPKSKDGGTSIGKIAGYVAGAAAVATGGYFAWKKWGTGSVAE